MNNATVSTATILPLTLPSSVSFADAYSTACAIALQLGEAASLFIDGTVVAIVTVEQARARRAVVDAAESAARSRAEEQRKHRGSGCPGCLGCR